MDGPLTPTENGTVVVDRRPAPANFQSIVDYLASLLEITLGATRADLEAQGSLLAEDRLVETRSRCSHFASNSQVALYAHKEVIDVDDVNDDVNDDHAAEVLPSRFRYSLSFDLSRPISSLASVAILKRPRPLDLVLPLNTQLQVINLPGLGSFDSGSLNQRIEILHSVVHLALAPYFDALTKGQDAKMSMTKPDAESKTGITGAKKKMAELELSLLHLQHNVEIPQLSLAFHPVVQSALDEAAKLNIKPSISLVPPDVLSDSSLHNNLQNLVNGWIKSIQTITKTSRDPSSGTAAQEINFWLSMETTLEDIERQLRSEGVTLTMEILKFAKRFGIAVSFVSDTGLKEAAETVQRYNQLMRDFPLDELLSATSMQKVEKAIGSIFNHLNKKLRVCYYPIRRALALVEGISADLNARLHALIVGRSLMPMPYTDFENLVEVAEGIWRTWDDSVREFTNVARDLTRRRNEKFIPIKITARHDKTQERLQYVHNFRKNHEQLQRTIMDVLGPGKVNRAGLDDVDAPPIMLLDDIGGIDAVEEVAAAFASLRDVDVLDVSSEGTQAWTHAETTYNERVSRVENSIIARLRDRLATARTANEMFRVFSKFNTLFVRPKIRGAIAEYQTQLIENVKYDISNLHERFKAQYVHSEAHAMAQLRDIPPVSGAIVWARQIERQLDEYMKKVGDVLGSAWMYHAEGEKLQSESLMFRHKLDTRPIYETWLQEVTRANISVSGRLFEVNRVRATGTTLELVVNFDPKVIALFRETRNIVWLNYSVPAAISNVAKDAKRVYPYAISLTESVRIYMRTVQTIAEMPDIAKLLGGYQNDAQSLIVKGLPLKWESFIGVYNVLVKQPATSSGSTTEGYASGPRSESKHLQYIRDFATSVALLQSKSITLAMISESVQRNLFELKTCPYSYVSFQDRLVAMQKSVDQLNLESFVNLAHWVAGINRKIENILLERVRSAVQHWIEAFERREDPERAPPTSIDSPLLERSRHEVSMRNQVIYLDPPLQFTKARWLAQLQQWLSVICNQRRLQSSRYEISLTDSTVEDSGSRFADLATRCADLLTTAYASVDNQIYNVSQYVDKWLQFQSLWDLQSEQVYQVLGDGLENWLQLLQEIREARSTFDTSEASRSFGHVIIDYEQVQMKVNSRYDQWQHEILVRFEARLGARMNEAFAEIQSARKDLEAQLLEASSTVQAVRFITTVQQYTKKHKAWGPEVQLFRQGQTTLSRLRRQLPANWLHIDQVEHEYNALTEVLFRKTKIFQEQIENLRAKIIAQDKMVNQRASELIAQWKEEKPISGTIPPDDAYATLKSFESRFTSLQTAAEEIAKAKDALNLSPAPESVLTAVLEELQDLKSVWTALIDIWSAVNELREVSWTSVNPRKLRTSLESLAKLIKDMPVRMRQYAAFEYVHEVLSQLQKVKPLLSDLRSEAVRERHWLKIFKTLRSAKRYSTSMTLGDVWDLQLGPSETVIRDVIAQAQGEMALEEFLRNVRDVWQNYSLELTNYQSKCRLIRGWDDLFARCSEHINSLQAMKHSPYYKEFEEEASSWEDKLSRVHILFDVWIDVQRQWVYLEGVFGGSADIKHLLPLESSRFQNINSEFYAVMRKVYRSPQVLDVLAIPGVQKSLERLAELLSKIQKALGEYLEHERLSFPRFYFVGDEDLLEIIGNSTDTVRVSKHLQKMFAGIAGLVLKEGPVITGFTSKEGEVVHLSKEISLIRTPKINEWLSALEMSMKLTLAEMLAMVVPKFQRIMETVATDDPAFLSFVSTFPTQVVVLATQVCWTSSVEGALRSGGEHLPKLLETHISVLQLLAKAVLGDLELIQRKKCEGLITEFVHQRDVIDKLIKAKAASTDHFIWLLQMRYAYNGQSELLSRVQIQMANATFDYGFEYLGIPDRLVRTPLTDRCFLTLTQALCQRLGGSPYGPAGTGKTESVKALGVQLGRFTLVFNCDDTFDFRAMGRIFLGVCQVGAWGCFDEFNRLEERILSAVSQQIQNIQLGLRKTSEEAKVQIELVGRQLTVNTNTGIFVTMNPGYAGRFNLPDNLKKLFRSVAMSKPDKELIAEVMLYSQGFSHAKVLSKQIVPFFDNCARRLSNQAHYDFGLRALKSVLVSSGELKRARLGRVGLALDLEDAVEPQIIVQSIRETMAPKLVKSDLEILKDIENEVFPGVQYVPAALSGLRQAIVEIAKEEGLAANETWTAKLLQLYQIQRLHHGVMMVGKSGCGKSTAWRILLKALQRAEGLEGIHHVIDPKVMSKEALYGSLDSTTREWADGLFTSIFRKIVDNLRGEDAKRHWIVFDGDVDPEWVENLNSVLDDNKLLTLPNGERLSLPPNVRILFETQTLKHATLATVSRCGMVWFSDDVVTPHMMVANYLSRLILTPFEDLEEDNPSQSPDMVLEVQRKMANVLEQRLVDDSLLDRSLAQAGSYQHVMAYSHTRALNTLFSLLTKVCRLIMEYNAKHPDFPVESGVLESFVSKKLLLALVWSFTGDCPLENRKAFGDLLSSLTTEELPEVAEKSSLIDFDVSLPRAQWTPWENQVPTIEVSTHSVTQTDVVIPTLDTVRHEDILYSWLAEHKPVVLCGPPGSGKTMTLFSALRKLPNMEVVGLNFSSATAPSLVIKTLEQYCEYKKTLNGVIMSPAQVGRWLVVFCDEINLPAPDKYGTQRVISFLRQLVEHNGFWRSSDKTWVSLDRVQFVGACNPPTDVGRSPLSSRFLRHAPVVMVDYPGEHSLMQIYKTFNTAVLKVIPTLRGYAEPLTSAMIDLYLASQERFTPDIQPHYVYSPRELTRWLRGIYEAIRPLETLSLEGLIRIWAHEALRLFQDRLITEVERQWTEDAVDRIALKHFPTVDRNASLARPILYSNWLSRNYVPVDRNQLREFVKARLGTFCEEEVDVPLVLFDDVLDHVLRMDRVFRQPQGHLILIGVSGSGKTTLSRFVAWMNGLKVFQIKVHGKYSAEDFDDDLRNVLKRSGCKDEKICFIMDESNVLQSGFLERMNTLLANAEIPGLFEGDEFASLMTACKEGAQRQGLLLDSQEELYKWFTGQIIKNLHVVFTMNPPEEGLSKKAATSPALFNRCVLNWFGDWSDEALFHVGAELTHSIDLDKADFRAPESALVAGSDRRAPMSHREIVVNAMVYVHKSVGQLIRKLEKQQNKSTYLTPRHFLDFISHYTNLYSEKREDLEDQQRHLNVGLDKLQDTVEKVSDLRHSLAQKKDELERKNIEANQKLQRMVADQRQAEQRRTTSLEIQVALERQDREVALRREVVLNDLAKAEPAVLEAQKSVSNIKKQHLTEVRSMGNPPAGVRLALESVCVLLGHKVDSWKTVQSLVRRDDFIASIVNFDNERQMTPNLRLKMRNDFLSNEDFTYERVNRASKACGPLVQWVEAQVNFSDILERVGPLRAEVEELEEHALQTRAEAQAIENNILVLENSIARYKTEYAALISETEAIKTEMSRVQFKVDRSVRLLESLSSERARWESSSKAFVAQTETMIGDVLIAAASMTYGGFFDQQYRRAMAEDWAHNLATSGIRFKIRNALIEYLSTPDERLRWQQNGLPVDELCTENAIMLKRSNRYPLIIDPSGRVTEFLRKESNDRRLTVTSFLDDSFPKQLESCLRFGNPILIHDAERLDPILNNVLNKEYQRTGGRTLVRLGKQEIDFSPSFKVYLATRDPSAAFPPDVCSRTTLVNFTVTQSSLQTQSLDQVLKSERPDIDEKRANLAKIQGEFQIRLRKLEKRLLQALNESRGNILDDDHLIETLETLKNEAAEITRKASETEGVMEEIDQITQQFSIVARSCSAIFSVLQQLHHINHFYQFSLQYFVDIFESVLSQVRTSGLAINGISRIDQILRSLFVNTYHRTSLSLLQHDRLTLAMLLVQAAPYRMDKTLIDFILDEDLGAHDVSTNVDQKDEAMRDAARHPALKTYLDNIQSFEWDKFLEEEQAENFVPIKSVSDLPDLDRGLRGLMLVKMLRFDRFVPAVENFVMQVFWDDLLSVSGDLDNTVQQVSAVSPIALCSNAGFDASYKVEHLIELKGKDCTSLAMGANESESFADKAIINAAASGSWVFIKNVHLAPAWLQSLEKRIDSLKPHKDFRLFLSTETSPKIPVNLIRASRILMYEQPAGIKANVKDTLSSFSTTGRVAPVEKARLYVMLSLLHAVVQERLRYVPTLGWNAAWQFNDSDYDCCVYIVDSWIRSVAHDRTNVAPESIPWEVLRVLITEMYGGKVDHEADFHRLSKLVRAFLTPAAFEENHNIIQDIVPEGIRAVLTLPESTGWPEFMAWVDRLPEREPPTYLGLPPDAERQLLVGRAKEMIGSLKLIMTMLDESESVMAEDFKTGS